MEGLRKQPDDDSKAHVVWGDEVQQVFKSLSLPQTSNGRQKEKESELHTPTSSGPRVGRNSLKSARITKLDWQNRDELQAVPSHKEGPLAGHKMATPSLEQFLLIRSVLLMQHAAQYRVFQSTWTLAYQRKANTGDRATARDPSFS